MIYLLHFSKPYKHARHYLGYAEHDVQGRIEQHRKGQGARLTQVAVGAGIELIPAQIWMSGTRRDERKLKNRHNAPKLCPFCRNEKSPKG